MVRIELVQPDVFSIDSAFDLAPLGLVRFPARTVVFRTGKGELIVHAPLGNAGELFEQLDELGPVAHLIAPNLFHHTYIGDWAERYPDATLHLAPGLADKRSDLPAGRTLSAGQPIDDDLSCFAICGMRKIAEHIFVHGPSRSLVVTDFVFNIREFSGLMTGLVLRMAGAHRRCAQSRLIRALVDDKAEAAASARAVIELAASLDRLIPAHGEIVDLTSAEQSAAFGTALTPMAAAGA